MRRKNIDSFRVIYQIVLFFNRLFHVIFRVTFFINLSKEEISKKMKRNISNVKQSAQQDRSTFVKTIQKRFLDDSILPWYNKFNQTPCKTVPISQSCRVSFRCTFPFPTRNLHSTVPSFFEFLFATNGPPDLFEILIDPFVRSKMSVVALI